MPRVGQIVEQPPTAEQLLRGALRMLLQRLRVLQPFEARTDENLAWLAENATIHLPDERRGLTAVGPFDNDLPF